VGEDVERYYVDYGDIVTLASVTASPWTSRTSGGITSAPASPREELYDAMRHFWLSVW
jgi:hypothetical protein